MGIQLQIASIKRSTQDARFWLLTRSFFVPNIVVVASARLKYTQNFDWLIGGINQTCRELGTWIQ